MTKLGFKTIALSIILLVGLLCAFTFIQSPSSESFEWSSINPLEGLAGIAFALSFGLGVPVAISIICILILLFGIWIGLVWLLKKIIK